VGNVASGVAGGAVNVVKSATGVAGDVATGAGQAVTGTLKATGETASKLGNVALNSAAKVVDTGKSAATAVTDIATTTAQKVLNIPNGVLQGDIANLLGKGLVAGKHYPVGMLHFNSKQSNISRDDQAKLNAVTQIAKAYPSVKIHLHGHADSSGPEKFNQYLSSQRAVKAKQLLIKAGVAATQIMTHGHGSSKPVATNNSPQGRWKNRRTEIEIQQ
jgi:OOP family OmpA-OmpF porin